LICTFSLFFLNHCYSTFVSVPADFGGLSVDSYISGIIAGILQGAGFPSRVTAHSVTLDETEATAAIAASNSAAVAAAAATSLGVGAGSSYSQSSIIYIPGLPPRKEKTVFLVKFAASVIARDSQVNY
jgi:Transport protein particle (TRAPP) component